MIYTGIYEAKLKLPFEGETFGNKGTVLIFPGGGYEHLSERESLPVAAAFRKEGFRSAILYYDVQSPVLGYRPLCQAAWAVGFLRQKYPKEPVFVLGFSSGGHCAGNLTVHWEGKNWRGEDALGEVRSFFPESEETPCFFRPDAAVLCYPVITSGEAAHRGSFLRLLGEEKDWAENQRMLIPQKCPAEVCKSPAGSIRKDYQEALHWLSLETQVDERTPPVFLWQTQEDAEVPVQNSFLMAQSLLKAGIPMEMHIYPKGAHGLSLATKEVEQPEKNRMEDPHVAGWFQEMIQWLNNLQVTFP
ncbi:MAG: prolyl oligopeptidase family serine peptidase [Blautia sp.]|nr:prolyl oligopeptidase family serine peptidase [Blautia sp.]